MLLVLPEIKEADTWNKILHKCLHVDIQNKSVSSGGTINNAAGARVLHKTRKGYFLCMITLLIYNLNRGYHSSAYPIHGTYNLRQLIIILPTTVLVWNIAQVCTACGWTAHQPSRCLITSVLWIPRQAAKKREGTDKVPCSLCLSWWVISLPKSDVVFSEVSILCICCTSQVNNKACDQDLNQDFRSVT